MFKHTGYTSDWGGFTLGIQHKTKPRKLLPGMAKGAEKKAEQRKAAELKLNGGIVVVVSVSQLWLSLPSSEFSRGYLQVLYWAIRLVWQEAPSTLWQWAGIATLYGMYAFAVRSIADASAAAHMASVGTAGA